MKIRQKFLLRNKIQKSVIFMSWLSILICTNQINAQTASAFRNQSESAKNPVKSQAFDKQHIAAQKSSPTLIDFGSGIKDMRLSEMGGSGVANFSQATKSAAAYNSTNGQYLVVWQGDNQNDEKDEIYGQLIDARTGSEVGENDFLIARMDGDEKFDAKNPTVIYNKTLNEFIVVWQGVHTATDEGLAEEIFARRVAADGSLLQLNGSPGGQINDYLRVSQMGADDENPNFDAFDPDLAWNPVANELFVVWAGDSLKNGDKGIFGQFLHFDGGILSEKESEFQISTILTTGPEQNDSESPAVVFNQTNSDWLIVWAAEDDRLDSFAIYNRRLSGDGTPAGNPLQIGTTPFGDTREPDISWNAIDNQYLVVWSGLNIYGQLLDNVGSEIGSDFIIGSAGRSFSPQVSHNFSENSYLVVWSGDNAQGGKYQIYGQQLSNAGTETGINDFIISDMGPANDTRYGAHSPQVSYSDNSLDSYLVEWSGDDNTKTVDDELEIFSRIVGPEADLAIVKNDGLTSVNAGTMLTYTITVSNNGPYEVFSTTIWDSLPAQIKNAAWSAVGANGADGFETSGSGNIRDSGIHLPNGASIIYTVNALVDTTTPDNTLLMNTASVMDEIVIDPVPDNNSSTDGDTRVINQADLAITKDDHVKKVSPGGTLTYTITISNKGPVATTNTTVTDSFPIQLTAVSWTATGTGGANGFELSGSGHLVDTGIGLPNGAAVTYTVSAVVDPTTADSTLLSNAASVLDSLAVDPEPGNNLATDNNTMVLTAIGDVDPPVITVKDTLEIWPPNHKYVLIRMSKCIISIKDSVDGFILPKQVVIDSVWSDEADSARFSFDFDQLDSLFAELTDGHFFDKDDDKKDKHDHQNKILDGDHDGWDDHDDGDDDGDCYDHDDGDDDDGDWYDHDNGDEDDEWDNHDDCDGHNYKKRFPDIIIGPFCNSVLLRREREGDGNGRVYTLHISVSDSAGNKGTARLTISIPHDKSGRKAIDDGPTYTMRSRCAEEPPPTNIDETAVAQLPEKVNLHQNYPNPFNPETTIRFELPISGFVQLRIFNILGQEVRELTHQHYSPGTYSLIWDGRDRSGRDVASGIYIYQLQAAGVVINKKLILMR